MEEVTITITIPESEYKKWNEYETDGVTLVRMNLKRDLREALKNLHIRDFEIEVDSTED